MANIIEARVKQKVATEAEWLTFDLIPLEGEQCFVKDSMGNNIGFKLGNGVARYSELPMWSTAGAVYLSDLADVGIMSVSEGDLFSFVGGRWNAISGNTYVKPDGGTWGINISGSAQRWEDQYFDQTTSNNNISSIMAYNVNSNLWSKTEAGQTLPFNVSGNANSATNWGGRQADFSEYDTSILWLAGGNNPTGIMRPYQSSAVRTFLGIPSGGETLQSVTDRGNTTTKQIVTNFLGDNVISSFNGITCYVGVSALYGYVGTKSNHPLVITINDLEQVRINLNGNVGIGTTSPTEKLDVNGKGKFLGLDAGNELIVPTSAPTTPISGKTYLWVS